jgi:hypothetical protein
MEDGAKPGLDELRAAAVHADSADVAAARLGFHRAFPHRSARRVLYVTQAIAFALCAAMFVLALWWAPSATLNVVHVSAWLFFASAILVRLFAAAQLTPALSGLAAPTHWPTYTVLCPLYREANVAPDTGSQ